MDLISLVMALIVFCLVVYVGVWGINKLGLPDPIRICLLVLLILICLSGVYYYAPFPARMR